MLGEKWHMLDLTIQTDSFHSPQASFSVDLPSPCKPSLFIASACLDFVCRCKWVLDVATAVIFTGKLARRLGNSWSGICSYTAILQAVDFVIFRAIDAHGDATVTACHE